jgi:hypothetical protein
MKSLISFKKHQRIAVYGSPALQTALEDVIISWIRHVLTIAISCRENAARNMIDLRLSRWWTLTLGNCLVVDHYAFAMAVQRNLRVELNDAVAI